ncbi:MAG: hypothetical protein HC778_03870 [Chamaesiphon sp. CSU_1_12]|nr:hypothetical protein [Chamaesiphon sp. CSU_1_12]
MPVADSSIAGWATSVPKLIDVPASGDLSGNFPSDDDRTLIQPLDAGAMTPGNIRRAGNPSTAWHSAQDRLGSGKVVPAMRVEHPLPAPIEPPIPTASAIDGTTDDNLIHFEQERQRRRPLCQQPERLTVSLKQSGSKTLATTPPSSPLLPVN